MKKKTIPKFASEDKEREFWADHEAIEFIDFSQAKPALFPNLKRYAIVAETANQSQGCSGGGQQGCAGAI